MKYPRSIALPVAESLLALVRQFSGRAVIAGSLRRGKELVSDIEILYEPTAGEMHRRGDLFPTATGDRVSVLLENMLADGIIAKRRSETGNEAWGAKNKLAVHIASGIPVDFFCEPSPEDWWRSLVIRTGPKDFNVRLILCARDHGVAVHASNDGFTKLDMCDPENPVDTGTVIPCESEEDVFRVCGMPYVEPELRV